MQALHLPEAGEPVWAVQAENETTLWHASKQTAARHVRVRHSVGCSNAHVTKSLGAAYRANSAGTPILAGAQVVSSAIVGADVCCRRLLTPETQTWQQRWRNSMSQA